jgi:hypothetical protein
MRDGGRVDIDADDVSGSIADRKEAHRVIIDLRMKLPRSPRLLAARCQFQMWSKVSPQHSAFSNTQVASLFSPARPSASRFRQLGQCTIPLRISFWSLLAEFQKFRHRRPFSYCYELQLAQNSESAA